MYVRQVVRMGLVLGRAVLVLVTACTAAIPSQLGQHRQQEAMTRGDINTVLEDHDQELLAIAGVVGVSVGLLPDETTLCLQVMVVKKSEELRKKIPKSIEGYPVRIEESGVIRPLR
jgi:hypothetical protein